MQASQSRYRVLLLLVVASRALGASKGRECAAQLQRLYLPFELRAGGQGTRWLGMDSYTRHTQTGTREMTWTHLQGINLPNLKELTSDEQRCSIRYSTLEAAQHACDQLAWCRGITRDSGMACKLNSTAAADAAGAGQRPRQQRQRQRRRRRAPSVCKPRNVYLDLGVNWCNTLELYRSVPEVARGDHHTDVPWDAVGFEAAPLIAPHAERCANALSAGLPLPALPVPPSGSSNDLAILSKRAQYRDWKKRLGELVEVPALSSNRSLVDARLASAARCDGVAGDWRGRDHFLLVPAAVSDRSGTLRLYASPEQMLRGGAMQNAGGRRRQRGQPEMRAFDAIVVDFVSWFHDAYRPEDFVVLKMDIEGAEREIVEGLISTGAMRNVDVILWECHVGVPWCETAESCARASGVQSVYREPYPFAPKLELAHETARLADETRARRFVRRRI
jgi:FkbM family methyltransferase